MKAMDTDTAIEAANHVDPNNIDDDMPTIAETTCPTNTFLGIAALESGMANNMTADAPNDAMNNGASYSNDRNDIANIATKDPVTLTISIF